MTPTLRAMATAFQDELRRQGVLYPPDPGMAEPHKLMMGSGDVADLTAALMAALWVLRDDLPVDVLDAACAANPPPPYNRSTRIGDIVLAEHQALIDAVLKGTP